MNDTPSDRSDADTIRPSRRSFLTGSAALTAGAAGSALLAREAAAQSAPTAPDNLVEITFTLNGEERTIAVDPRRTLLDQLREAEGLTGTKVGCRHGQCGACTCHVDGEPYLACLTLAAQLEGREVTTIEGLAAQAEAEGIAGEDGLHPVQTAFVENDAFQCGYCTPGQIMSAVATIKEGHASSAAEVREYMSGNLCRCAAYPQITAAVMAAKKQMERDGVEIADGGGARADYHIGLLEPNTEFEAAGASNPSLDPPVVSANLDTNTVREG